MGDYSTAHSMVPRERRLAKRKKCMQMTGSYLWAIAWQARKSGVRESPSLASTSAPNCRRTSMPTVFRPDAAMCSGDLRVKAQIVDDHNTSSAQVQHYYYARAMRAKGKQAGDFKVDTDAPRKSNRGIILLLLEVQQHTLRGPSRAPYDDTHDPEESWALALAPALRRYLRTLRNQRRQWAPFMNIADFMTLGLPGVHRRIIDGEHVRN